MIRLVAAAACALVLMARGGTTRGGGTAPQGNALEALSAAITATNSSRAAALAALHRDDTGVAIADQTDQDALAGEQTVVAPKFSAAAASIRGAASAINGTRADVGAYAAALTLLQTAAVPAHISAAQRSAISSVVSRGRAEDAALRTSAAAYASALPTFQAVLVGLQTWYLHVRAGFFDTALQAGGAYQVQRTPQAAALGRGRAAIAAADGPRRTTAEAMGRALTAARAALASLA